MAESHSAMEVPAVSASESLEDVRREMVGARETISALKEALRRAEVRLEELEATERKLLSPGALETDVSVAATAATKHITTTPTAATTAANSSNSSRHSGLVTVLEDVAKRWESIRKTFTRKQQ
eukprot:TRINITY_DN15586_c1_g1_i1.p1 TRINITY_DN15586_c1_g1~~TRINITY_DN15586_c1_g1_i1.p1  ORF type:complete len:138 (-),score=40.03 TRINITY_DN15586_c1_g1_i1:53-424(-)